MLVQVGATSPPLRPAPMTKLDLLLQQAEVSARSALIGTREQLRPLFHMIHANGQESLTGVPWRDDGEKETTLALVRALMRAGDVVAYSILTEAWSATPAESWKLGEPLPIAPTRAGSPRSGNRRRVQSSPPHGRDVAHRAGRGRALHRPRPHARRRRNGRSDAEITFHIPLWRPWEGRWRPLRAAGLLLWCCGPSQGKARRPSQAGARAVQIVGAHLDARRNRARPKGRIRAPIDKVEPTVDTAGP